MGRVGSALDNSPAEAFNSTLKVEFVHRHRFRTRVGARLKIVTWITGFYNAARRHSLCGGRSPIDYETHMATPHGHRPSGGRSSPVTRRGRIKDPPHFEGIDRPGRLLGR
ncbi:integrase core domain-containing protein [Nocardia sp. NPDC004260]